MSMPTRTRQHHRLRRTRHLACVTVLVLGAAACGDDDKSSSSTDTSAPSTSEIAVTEVWARTSAAGQANGAAYMVITGGAEDDSLVGASVDVTIACETQLHETVPAEEGEEGSMTETSTTMKTDTEMGSDTTVGSDTDPCADLDDMSGDMTTTTAAAGSGGTDAETDDEMKDDEGMDGAMTMREVDAIDVPAGKKVVLEPGGYHVMLIRLIEPLVAGDKFDIELEFEKAGKQTVTAEVRDE
jgi:copper(I)-binding protein